MLPILVSFIKANPSQVVAISMRFSFICDFLQNKSIYKLLYSVIINLIQIKIQTHASIRIISKQIMA